MKPNWNLVGIIATIGTGLLAVVSNVVESKKIDETIEEKVNEALAKREEEPE